MLNQSIYSKSVRIFKAKGLSKVTWASHCVASMCLPDSFRIKEKNKKSVVFSDTEFYLSLFLLTKSAGKFEIRCSYKNYVLVDLAIIEIYTM